jgi:hypothetical protein
MKVHKGALFVQLDDRNNPLSFRSEQFENCEFINCLLSYNHDNKRRSSIRGVHLKNCAVQNCSVGPAIFEDCTIENLRNTGDLLIMWGPVFRHVTLSGPIGSFKVNETINPMNTKPEYQKPFDDFREAFYRDTDWALDISAARFEDELDIRGIPARLFRRDPETQMVITRQRALQPGWTGKLSPDNTLWPFMIRLFLSDGDEDMVLAAPMGARKAERDNLLRGLKELRELGVAEPD